MKQLLTLTLALFSLLASAQVGVGTTTPDASAQLEISSTDKGMLIPRVADTTAITSPANGVMIFDLSQNAFAFYDNGNWKYLVYTEDEPELNRYAGQVKINGANGNKIVFNNANGNQVGGNLTNGEVVDWEDVVFPAGTVEGDLDISSSPTTQWPGNVDQSSSTLQGTIYNFSTGTFIENNIPGQTHIWRFIISFEKNSGATGVVMRLFNPNPSSSFDQRQLTHISPEHELGTIVFNIVTIGDNLSIPGLGDPNANGYRFQIGSDDPISELTIESITRISLSTN